LIHFVRPADQIEQSLLAGTHPAAASWRAAREIPLPGEKVDDIEAMFDL
jgi:hypothetical protein